MATSVLQNCKLWVNGFDMSGWMNRLGLDYDTDVLDYTKWGDTSRVSVGGLERFAFNHQGLWQTPGPDGDVAQDTFTDTDRNLTAHTPDLGFGGWTYSGAANEWTITSNKANKTLSNNDIQFCRSDNDIVDDDFEVRATYTRSSGGDFAGEREGLYLLASGVTAIANGEGVEVVFVRSGAGTVNLRLVRRDSSGAEQQNVLVQGLTITTGNSLDIGATVSGQDVTPWTEPAGGGARTNYSPVTLTVDLRDGAHKRIGLTGRSESNAPGPTMDNLTVRAPNSDGIIFDNIGTTPAFALSPLAGAVGDVAYLAKAGWARYEIGPATIGDLLRFKINGNGAGPLVRGVVLENSTVTSSGTGTAVQQGAVGATEKMYAVLHVLSAEGSITVTVESDDNEAFSSASTRFTFGGISAGQSVEWATPVNGVITDTWWRAEYTVTGSSPSIEFVLAMGIK